MSEASAAPPQVLKIIHHTFARGGGMERYAADLCAGMKAAGWAVEFHCYKADVDFARQAGIALHMHPVSKFPRRLQDYRFFRDMEKSGVLESSPQICLSRLRSRGLIICGGTHRGYLARMGRAPGIFDRLQIWMETQGYLSARKIISHSRLCAEEIVKLYGIAPQKIVTIHPPVSSAFNARLDPAERRECRRQLGLPADKIIFLFPSNGHKRKGLKPLFNAMKKFGDRAVLAVAGKPPTGYAAPFLHYVGSVRDMRSAFSAADYTILGSYYEPFGLVGVESVLCGTRLVFEENAGCLEVMKPEETFRFSVGDPGTIHEAISRALSLAETGRHRIVDIRDVLTYDYSVATHVKNLLAELK